MKIIFVIFFGIMKKLSFFNAEALENILIYVLFAI